MVKMSCLGVKPKSPTETSPESGIIIHLYRHLLTPEEDRCLKFTTPGKVYTVEGLCWHAAVKLNIAPISFHIFSLYCLQTKQWVASNDTIEVKEGRCQEFEFRIRLKMSKTIINQLPSLDPATLDYLYLQCSHDFVTEKNLGNHTKCTKEEWAKKCLGLGIISATCCLVYFELEPSSLGKVFKRTDVLPPKCTKYFSNFLNSQRLNRRLQKSVKKCYQVWKGKINLDELKLQYILNGIFEYYDDYLVEEFRTNFDEVYIVDPLQRGGLFNQNTCTLVTRLQNIKEIYIDAETNRVTIIKHCSKVPINLEFSSERVARSLVSLLEKYYRMTVDNRISVCKSVYSPLVLWMQETKVHGPVKGSWAVEKLQKHIKEFGSEMQYNFVLKQLNRSTSDQKASLWNIELVWINQKHEVRHHFIEWDYNPDAFNMWDLPCFVSVDIEHKFLSVEQLLSSYSNALSLEKCLQPQQIKQTDERLLLCKSDNMNSNIALSLNTSPQILSSVTIYKQNIFQGRFTNVYTGSYGAHPNKLVAVKQLKLECFRLFDIFTKNVHKVLFWNDFNIVSVHGICMEESLSLVMEYAPLGNLQDYLSNKEKSTPVKVLHLVCIACQISSALCYLHGREEIHSNIRCRNILIFSHDAHYMLVKLADPGMINSYYHQTPDDSENIEVLPWLAPELFEGMDQVSPESDMYSFGMTLWEMFSMGKRPFNNIPSADILQLTRNELILKQPAYCPRPVYDLIQQCCHPDPPARPKSRVVRRHIEFIEKQIENVESTQTIPVCEHQSPLILGSAKNSEQISIGSNIFSEHMPTSTSNIELHDELPDRLKTRMKSRPLPVPPIVRDPLLIQEKELCIDRRKKLGKGIYGKVYLARYTKDGCNPREVAVKSLKADICRDQFKREFEIMAKLQHDNIVAIIGYACMYVKESDVEQKMIVMEYIENGSLEQFLPENKRSLNQNHLMGFAIDISKGMSYLTSKGIVHNDLAGRNVLVTSERRAKISDFGLARIHPKNEDYYKIHSNYIPVYWWAPEAILYNKVSQKSDVWSYGVTLWEIYSLGKSPRCLGDSGDVAKLLQEGTRLPTKLLNCPQGVRDLMKKCWEYDPKKRPEFADINNDLESNTIP